VAVVSEVDPLRGWSIDLNETRTPWRPLANALHEIRGVELDQVFGGLQVSFTPTPSYEQQNYGATTETIDLLPTEKTNLLLRLLPRIDALAVALICLERKLEKSDDGDTILLQRLFAF